MPKRRKDCIVCGNELKGKRFIYCSDTCHTTRTSEIAHAKVRGRRKKIDDKSCEVCFKTYKPIRSVQKCCSDACREVKRNLYLLSKRKEIKQIECKICNTLFRQRNHLHFNCSDACRQIDFKGKERNTIRIRPTQIKENNIQIISAFTHFQLTNYSFDKALLRQELKEATATYLKKNKITRLPDSPSAKVPAVGMTSLRIFGDEREFYEDATTFDPIDTI